MERLQKVMAQYGIASRRKAEELIKAGRVKVNGQTITELGTKVNGNDIIEVDGVQYSNMEEKVTYVFYKPRNVIATVLDEKGRTCIADFFRDVPQRLYPVGRLDYDSSGLIFVSNDGEFTQMMIHPKYHIGKVYEVTIDGLLSNDDLDQLRKGIELEDGKTAPCKVSVDVVKPDKPLMKLKITLYEGKNRQIRRMIAHFGLNVTRLCRVEFGHVMLKPLKPGEYRRLRKDERKMLVNQALSRNE